MALPKANKLFLKSKGKKHFKASKTVKKLNNGDKIFVTVRHPKTFSDLLNPIIQSKIITRELETVEKSTFLTNNQLLSNTNKRSPNYVSP